MPASVRVDGGAPDRAEQRRRFVFFSQEKDGIIDDVILAQSWVCSETGLYQSSYRAGGALEIWTVGRKVLVLFDVSLSLDGRHFSSLRELEKLEKRVAIAERPAMQRHCLWMSRSERVSRRPSVLEKQNKY